MDLHRRRWGPSGASVSGGNTSLDGWRRHWHRSASREDGAAPIAEAPPETMPASRSVSAGNIGERPRSRRPFSGRKAHGLAAAPTRSGAAPASDQARQGAPGQERAVAGRTKRCSARWHRLSRPRLAPIARHAIGGRHSQRRFRPRSGASIRTGARRTGQGTKQSWRRTADWPEVTSAGRPGPDQQAWSRLPPARGPDYRAAL